MSNIDTPVSHAEAAAAILSQLQAITESIPGFGFLTRGQRRRITASASVPDEFLLTVALALDASPEFANAARLRGSELRDLVNYSNACRAVVQQFQLMARGLSETIAGRRFELGKAALRAYGVAKTFNRPSEQDQHVPHILAMQRTLGRGRPRMTAPAEPDAPASAA